MQPQETEWIRTVRQARPYDVIVGKGLLDRAGDRCRAVNRGTRALIVSDDRVAPLYAGTVAESLRAAGYEVAVREFPAGESHKRLDTVADLYEGMAALPLTRDDLVVSLGGGVTGDLAGFAAATWLRGVDVVHCPTSLLAQVDAAVGGKTGVDMPCGKNTVGAFWPPARVLADVDTLATLPQTDQIDGWSEVIKTAAVGDERLWKRLEIGTPETVTADVATVAACVEVKARLVERDEYDTGERRWLNFGHTLGHALEAQTRYQTLSHGRAVAVGMAWITALSESKGITVPGTAERLRRVLTRWGLPITHPAAAQAWRCATAWDKKRSGDRLDVVLLRDIGQPMSYPIALTDLSAWSEAR